MDVFIEDAIEWLKKRKPSELLALAGVGIAGVVAAIVVVLHIVGGGSGAKTADSMDCGKFTGLSRDEQINVIHQTPGYLDKVPAALNSAAAKVAYNCRSYPANTPITNSNIMY